MTEAEQQPPQPQPNPQPGSEVPPHQPQPAPEMPPPPPPPPQPGSRTSPTAKTSNISNKVQKPTKRKNSARGLSELSTTDLTTHPHHSAVSMDQSIPISPAPDLSSLTPTPSFTPPYPATMPYHQNTTYYPGYPPSQQLSSPTHEPHSVVPSNNQKGSCCSAKGPSVDTAPSVPSCRNETDGVDTQQTPIEAQKEARGGVRSAPHGASGHLPHTPHSTTHLAQQSEPLVGLGTPGHPASAPVTGYSSPMARPQYGGANYISNNQPFPVYSQPSFDMSRDPNHNCGCGDGCQCLGCASHPFNDTTRQHIQEMGYMMALREDSPKENPTDSPYSEQQQYPKELGYSHLPINGNNLHPPVPGQTPTNYFEHTANLPNVGTLASSFPPAASANSTHGQGAEAEMMMMQPGAYLTVEYPVGLVDPCSNLSGTCQCGSSCTCVGCLTHNGHNGVPLEPSPPPENPDFAGIAAMQQAPRRASQDDTGAASFQISTGLSPGKPPGEYTQPDPS